MAFQIPTAWTAGTYSQGTQRIQNGVLYEVIVASTSTEPRVSTDWAVIAVHEITDYTSLVEAVRLNLNVDDDEINNSVPLFIQLAEESFKTRIRVPQQRKQVVLTVDSEGRIEVPGDLLEVINLRQNSDATTSAFRDLRSRGVIEILSTNYENYQRVRRFETANYYVSSNDYNAFDSPVFWYDNRYFWIAPVYATGTEMELVYYGLIPQLGSVVTIDGVSTTVDRNWYTSAAPQMLLYGALCKSEAYLKDTERVAQWKELFDAAQAETQDLVNRFAENQSHSLFIENTYSSRI